VDYEVANSTKLTWNEVVSIDLRSLFKQWGCTGW